jgi:hypothetical protein
MNQYSYSGPVMEFDRCIAARWKASTFAVSEKKALSNLAYQFKLESRMARHMKITLPGKLTMVG